MRQIVLALLLCLAAPAQAVTYIDLNYDNITLGNVDSGALVNGQAQNVAQCGGNQPCIDLINTVGMFAVAPNCLDYCAMQIVPTPNFPGSLSPISGHALRYEYRSDQDNEAVPHPQDDHNADLFLHFPSPGVSEVWSRSYFATDVDNAASAATSSQWFCCGSKIHYWKPIGAGPSIISGYSTGVFEPTVSPGAFPIYYGIQEFATCPNGGQAIYKNPAVNGGCLTGAQNIASYFLPDKQWSCWEEHLKLNSSTSAFDGLVEFYIDGRLLEQHLNLQWYDGFYTQANSQLGSVEIYRQHANHMIRYEKNFTVASTRVGCSGVGNPTVPLAPTTLRVQ